MMLPMMPHRTRCWSRPGRISDWKPGLSTMTRACRRGVPPAIQTRVTVGRQLAWAFKREGQARRGRLQIGRLAARRERVSRTQMTARSASRTQARPRFPARDGRWEQGRRSPPLSGYSGTVQITHCQAGTGPQRPIPHYQNRRMSAGYPFYNTKRGTLGKHNILRKERSQARAWHLKRETVEHVEEGCTDGG